MVRRQSRPSSPAPFAGDRIPPAAQAADADPRVHRLRDRAVAVSDTTAAVTPDQMIEVCDELVRITAQQRELGDLEGATATTAEVVSWGRRLTDLDPGRHRPALAGAVATHASLLDAVGDTAQALTVVREAIAIQRELADTDPAAHSAPLVGLLFLLGSLLAAVGEQAAAVQIDRDALRLMDDPAIADRSTHRPLRAALLANLADALAATGDTAAARDAATEAVATERTLDRADADPARLGIALRQVAILSFDLHDWQTALESARQAVSMLRPLVRESVEPFGKALAECLVIVADVRTDSRRDRKAALAAAQEAVSLTARLVAGDPHHYRKLLRGAMTVHAGVLEDLGRHRAAAAVRADLPQAD
jgi:hypothetical protein